MYIFLQPDPNKCRAVGVGLESAEKHQFSTFKVEVIDTDGNPCTGSHSVTVELKSRVDESITTGSVVSKTPAIHDITYQPRRSGEHEISVKVNGMHINSSPFVILVQNIPHPKSCKAVEHLRSPMQNSGAKFMVQLADAEGEPCVSKQEVTVEVKSLVDGSITTGSVASKTPATYEVSYQPRRSGEHELSVKVNGDEINGSPFSLLVRNIPHPNNCKAFGKGIKEPVKNELSKFTVQLADADGELCVTKQEVTAELKSLTDDVITKANIVNKTPATYEVSYQPSRSGEHELSVKVNGMEISDSPFALLVRNIPHPQKCKAIGEGITKAEKYKSSKFMVQLAGADGDPCVTKQEVIVELKSLVDGSITKGSVVSKTPATYEVSYQPRRSGEHEISVKVNGMHINSSPFVILVQNIPHPKSCKAVEHLRSPMQNSGAKFMVQLADAEGEPCVSKQEVTVEVKSLVDGSITTGSVASKTPATYEVSYQPRRSGEHELSVKVNGDEINGSPFSLLVRNIPHPNNCKAFGKGIKEPVKNELSKFTVQLADADGELCVTKQEVTAELKSLTDDVITKANIVNKTPATYEVSYQPSRSGEHELSVKVNGMEISDSPFALLVRNIPHPQKCKAIGEGITKAEKYKSSKFMVQLAGADGDPCVTKQEVIVELKSLTDDVITKANIVNKTPATYEVSYLPSRSGEYQFSVKVNGMEINDSPFALLVHNIPHPQRCKAVGEGITKSEICKSSKFVVQLADAEGDPCLTKQEIIAELISKVDGSRTKVNVVSKTPATYMYEATYRPNMTGEHALTVKVNGEAIQGSPFIVTVTWYPKLIKVIDGLHDPRGIAMGSDGVLVVIEEGGLSLLSKDGQRIRTIGSGIPRPTAVAVDGTGNIYTVSSGNVFKLNYDGEVKGDYLQQKYRNFGIAVSQDNVFFGGVQEIQPGTISRVILVFDTDLKLCTSFSISSSGQLACDSAGNLCVVDHIGVTVFSPNGTRLRTIMLNRRKSFFNTVNHVDYNNYIYVTYTYGSIFAFVGNPISRTSVFNKAGTFVTSLEHSYSPRGITTDEDGVMYICNSENGCIEVFH